MKNTTQKAENVSERNVRPFGLRDKIGYLSGELGNNFAFMFVAMYLMIFYTKVWGVSASLVGLLFLVARFIDAFSDVTMGAIIDKSNPGKDGKFKVWIRRMSGPLAIMTFLMFQSGLASAPMTVKVILMFATYIFWGSICCTAVSIPFGSMASAITDNPVERASLSTWRSLGSSISGVIIGGIVPLFIYYTDANGNQLIDPQKFTLIAGIFSALCFICYMICCKLTTERIKFEKKEKTEKISIIKNFKSLLGNKALMVFLLASIISLLNMLLSQTMNQYLFADYFKNIEALSMMNMIGLPICFLLAPMISKMSAKYGKKEMTVVGMFFAGIIYLGIYLMKIDNATTFLVISTVAGIGINMFNLLVWAIIGDIIDYNEVISGKRDDATVYGVYSFSRKIGQALAGGLGGFVLTAIGYDSLAKVQTAAVTNGIYDIATLVPTICYILIAIVIFVGYPLSKKVVEENCAKIAEARKAKAA